MATHSSVLAWRIPGTGEPGGLPSLGSHRVGHNWSDLAAAAVPETKKKKIFLVLFSIQNHGSCFLIFRGSDVGSLWVLSLFLFSYLFSHHLFPRLPGSKRLSCCSAGCEITDPAVRPHHHHSLLGSSGHDDSYQSGEVGAGTQLGQPTTLPVCKWAAQSPRFSRFSCEGRNARTGQ